MSTKYTPAPWAVCQEPKNEYWIKGVTIGAASPDDSRRICDLAEFGSDEMRKANGNLIEAAPELLEALQEMVKQFTKTPSTLADTNARVKAHKAIAKALGEQT